MKNTFKTFIKACLLMVGALLSSCLTDPNEDSYYDYGTARPTISFYKVDTSYFEPLDTSYAVISKLHNYKNQSEIVILIGEYLSFNPSRDAIDRDDLFVHITTRSQDSETVILNSDYSMGVGYRPVTFFSGEVHALLSKNATKHNGQLEINESGDEIIVQYRSIMHDYLVSDTLIYLGNNN